MKKIINNIETTLKKISFIHNFFLWKLARRWKNRFKLLRTTYRNSKIKAIKSYIKNDLECIKMEREIRSFRIGDIYNFNGIKLPFLDITNDTFLNVLKPNIYNIKYIEGEIEKFYNEQKSRYGTIAYMKDNLLKNEPDYAGGHIISHGFTYFFEEIMVNKNDVVIDLGAAPGDFAALCVLKGASNIYAFEPEENYNSNLEQVNKLNQDKIHVVRKYCGAKTNLSTNSISLDDFAKTNNLNKIDFIKADIEGGEVMALIGARDILRKYQPKLAFCTYHSINDGENIKKSILDANPNYKLYENKGIIYAF